MNENKGIFGGGDMEGLDMKSIVQAVRERKLAKDKALSETRNSNASTFSYSQVRRPGQTRALPQETVVDQNTQPTNAIDNTVQSKPAYDPLTQYNPADLDPTGGAALMPPSNEAANLADPATRSFGVAGIANNMFGTPFQRQRSVSKKYCKKNK